MTNFPNDSAENLDIKKANEILSQGGLSTAVILDRQTIEGLNEFPFNKPKKINEFIFDVLKEPMVYLILACGITYYFLGDHEEALMLLGFLFFIIGITVFQEAKSERALEALKELSSPRAEVLRDGIKKRIPGREVVREDIIILNEGDRIPADCMLISSFNLDVDESILTGESLPVQKLIGSSLFASTTITHGQGIAYVTSIGTNTQVGKIGKSILISKNISTKLEIQTRQLVTHLAWFAIGLCALVVIVHSQTRHNFIEGILVGLSLAMAILPNELPAVLTIFFALGAWRLSKKKILTRKISAIENLGSITILCVDKTGTLTLNQMRIQKIYSNEKSIDLSDPNTNSLPEEFHEILEFGILASKKDPYDPMELAFTSAGQKYLTGTEHLHKDWNLEKEYPLSSDLLSVSYAWKSNNEKDFIIGAKGAPEAILKLCGFHGAEENKLKNISEEMAQLGLRIIGVAKSHSPSNSLPENQTDFNFVFLGFVGIADPIRPEVKDSIAECKTAGIRVLMLTGDHPVTAKSIAHKIELENSDKVITGKEIDTLSHLELVNLVKEVNIFSRVTPAQKLLLVEALKDAGEIIAMTGDGVNDAPALKNSHIGIAMGGRGTDVARESSDIVLLNDDFSSIVEAIRTGRRIYTNLKNALVYLFSIHIPIAGMSVIPVLTKLPLVLLPAHIAYLHLIIEPASSVAFEIEPASDLTMKQKPRSPNEKLFDKSIWLSSFLRGFSLLIAVTSIYVIALWRGQGEADARTLVVCTLILSNSFLIYLSRPANISFYTKITTKPNFVVIAISLSSIVMLATALYIPVMRDILRFSFLHPIDIFICIAVTLANTFVSEFILKVFSTTSNSQDDSRKFLHTLSPPH